MAELTKSIRHRINVSRTSTGKYGWDCTVEYLNEFDSDISPSLDRGIALSLSDALVKELESRYPYKEAK